MPPRPGVVLGCSAGLVIAEELGAQDRNSCDASLALGLMYHGAETHKNPLEY